MEDGPAFSATKLEGNRLSKLFQALADVAGDLNPVDKAGRSRILTPSQVWNYGELPSGWVVVNDGHTSRLGIVQYTGDRSPYDFHVRFVDENHRSERIRAEQLRRGEASY